MFRNNSKQDSKAQTYYAAVRFTKEPQSAQVYRHLQHLLNSRDIVNLPVYRVLISIMPHVIVVGDQPCERGRCRIQEVLSAWEPVSLSHELISTLQKRRAQMETN